MHLERVLGLEPRVFALARQRINQLCYTRIIFGYRVRFELTMNLRLPEPQSGGIDQLPERHHIIKIERATRLERAT